MQIKNIEALKTWLTGRLEKICDADPAALAKYVVALVRKDKPLGELEEICIDQLEVFLANDTVSFVKTLFEVLQDNSYIPAPPTPATPLPELPEPQPIIPPAPPKPAAKRLLSTDESFRPQAAESSVLDEDDRDFRRTRKPTEEIEEKPSSIANRDFEYKFKKRRVEPDNDAGLRSKVSRGDVSDSTEGKGKQPSDSFKKKEGSDEHPEERSDKQRESSSDRENPQRRFDGPARGKHTDNKTSKNWMHKGRPWSNKRARCRDYDEKGFCMRGEFCLFDHGSDPLVVEDVTLPGIVLGFPHGARPPGFMPERPPLNPTGRIQGLRPPMPPMQFPIRPPAPPNVHVPTNPPPDTDGPPRHAAPRLPGTSQSSDEHRPPHGQPTNPIVRPRPPMPHYKEIVPNINDVYNPEQPSFDREIEKPPVWTRLGTQPPQHVNPMQRNRELLQVATSDIPTSSSPGPQETVVTAPAIVSSIGNAASCSVVKEEPPVVTKNVTTSPVSHGRKYTNTILEIKKLPPDKNNIATLNDYFQKFGKIVNIQVSAFGQADMALIQFSSNFEANKAITCADAILGNRFIRVFWYKADTEQKNQSQNVVESPPPIQTVEKPVAPTMFQTGKTSFKAISTPIVSVSKKDVPPRQMQEIMKRKLFIQKQKQQLLGKQIAQQKLLINKLEQNKNLNVNEKDKIMQTLKSVSESIMQLKSEVKVTVALAKSKESPAQARQMAKKELLDRELDLITHEQTGEDTTELRQRVEELKKEALSLGLLDSSHRDHGRGRARGAPRGFSRGRGHGRGRGVVSRSAAVLDKRPKQLLIEGYSGEERDLITQRFKEFGDINRIEQDRDANRVIVTFATRKHAETAIQKISTFNIKNLKVSWYRPVLSVPQATLKFAISETLEDSATKITTNEQEVEDILLGGDLDEEEEEEERSWRR